MPKWVDTEKTEGLFYKEKIEYNTEKYKHNGLTYENSNWILFFFILMFLAVSYAAKILVFLCFCPVRNPFFCNQLSGMNNATVFDAGCVWGSRDKLVLPSFLYRLLGLLETKEW